jgi:hypothetical protein
MDNETIEGGDADDSASPKERSLDDETLQDADADDY